MAGVTTEIPRPDSGSGILCSIRDLTVTYRTDSGEYPAVQGVNLDIATNEITAVIGESGSGKSTLGLALLNGVTDPGKITSGTVSYPRYGNILGMKERDLRKLRGPVIGTVFQASQNAMNPLSRVAQQIIDLGKSHGYKNPRSLLVEAHALARKMSMDADRVLTAFPHQLSGGMRQRVGLILALILHPQILLLDEPTTALDLLTQSTVLEIVKAVHRERRLTTILITHDMGVVGEVSDRVIVMYAGCVVEQGPTSEVMRRPRHPYTKALTGAIPRLTGSRERARALKGAPPDLTNIPREGCVFRDRCAFRFETCDTERPLLRIRPGLSEDHLTACHLEDSDD